MIFLTWNIFKIATQSTRLENRSIAKKSVTKNATEVDGGLVGWGHWCGAAVSTLMETVAAAQAQRFSITCTRTTCSFWNARGEGSCNVIVKEGALHKNFFHRHLRMSVFSYWLVGIAIEVCDGEKSCHCSQFFFIFGRRCWNLKNYGEFQFAITKYNRKCNSIIFPSYQ